MQQLLKRDGLALSVFFIMLKLLTDTLPPPEPVVPLPTVEGLLAPKEKDRISQAFLALKSLSVVSPSAGTAPPVTYMNESNAIGYHLIRRRARTALATDRSQTQLDPVRPLPPVPCRMRMC